MDNQLLGRGLNQKSTITAQTDTSPSVNNNSQPYSPSLREVMGVYNQVQSGNYELTDKGIAPRDLDVTAGDVLKSAGAGALDLFAGVGETFEQLTGYGAGLRDLANSASSAIKDSMTDDGQLALQRSIVSEDENGRLMVGDGAGDIDVWAMKFANSAGSMLPGVLAGGGAGLAARATLGGLVRSTMLKRGASQLIADKVANKTVEYIAKGAASGALTGGSVGSAALGAKEQLQGLGAGWLSRNSTSYQEIAAQIATDPETANLPAIDKENLAMDRLANEVSNQVSTDPKVWMASVAGTMGDMSLFKAIGGGATKSFIKGSLRSATTEGVSEALEEGTHAYSSNQALNDQAQAGIDPMQGVKAQAIEGGILGAGVGGTSGVIGAGIGKIRDKRNPQVESESAEGEPQTSPVDVSATVNAGPIEPQINPGDYGLSQEQADMLLNPDPDLLHVGMPPKGQKLTREEIEKLNARREYQKQYNDLINTDNAKAFVTDYKNKVPPRAASENNKEASQPKPQEKDLNRIKFRLTEAEAKALQDFTVNDDGVPALNGNKLSKEDKAQYLKVLAKRYKDRKWLFDLLKSDKAKAYLQQRKVDSENQFQERIENDSLPPAPSKYGLTTEEAEILLNPDLDYMDMGQSGESITERTPQEQEADKYKQKVEELLKSEKSKAFIQANDEHQAYIWKRDRELKKLNKSDEVKLNNEAHALKNKTNLPPMPSEYGLTADEAEMLVNPNSELMRLKLPRKSRPTAKRLKRQQLANKYKKKVRDLLETENGKAFLSAINAYKIKSEPVQARINPSDYGLTEEEAEILSNPDPVLMEMKLPKKGKPTAKRLKRQQEADDYKRKFFNLLNSKNGAAFLNAEGGYRVATGRQEKRLKEHQEIVDTYNYKADHHIRQKESSKWSDSALKNEQKEFIQRKRDKDEEQKTRDIFNNITAILVGPPKPTEENQATQESNSKNSQIPQKSSDEILDELRNHKKRLEAFKREEAREANKPENIKRRNLAEALFEDTTNGIKSITDILTAPSKSNQNANRLKIPGENSDEIIDALHSKKKQRNYLNKIEADKLQDSKAYDSAESVPSAEFKQFEQNSLTQALERASSIAKRDNLPPQTQEQIKSLLESYQLDQAESEDFNDPILNKAKLVIRSEIEAGNTQLKGIRRAYRQAGITAKEINGAVIRGGIAKNVARFEKQVAAQIQAKGLDDNQSGNPVEKTLPPSTSDDSGTYKQNGKDDHLQDNNLPEEPSAKSHANPLIDKAKSVINDTLVANQGGLKGVRKAYRGAGITANQVNDAVDESEIVLETLSQAAGDPRLFIRTKLAKEVERLQKRERLHAQSIYDAKQNKSKYQEKLSRLQEVSTQLPELKAWLENGTKMMLGNRNVGLKKASETLSHLIENNVKGGVIGSIGEFDIVFNPGWSKNYLEVHAPNGLVIARTETFTLNALKANIRNAIKNIPAHIREENRNLNSAKEAINAPFGRAQELVQKTQKLNALEQDLANNPTPPPLWLRDGAPISTSVFYNGREYEVTGHRWGKDDFYVLAENDSAALEVPYLSAKDAQGMAIYDKHDFEAPGALDEISSSNQSGEQAQKALDDTLSDPVFSRSLLGSSNNEESGVSRAIIHGPAVVRVRNWLSPIIREISAGKISLSCAIEVVPSESELPDYIQNRINKDGANGEVNGVYDNGTIYLVADKLHDKSSVEEVVLHEFIGHYGIRKVFEGKVVERELNRIWKKLGSEKQLLKIAKEMNIDLTAYIESYNRAYWNKEITLEQRQAAIVDEMIAHMAGNKRFNSNWNRLVVILKQWLRTHGFPNLAKYGKAELIDLVSKAQQAALTNTHSEINRENIGKEMETRRNIGYPGDDIQFSRKAAFHKPMPGQTLQDVLSKANGNLYGIIKDKVSGFGIDKLRDNKYALLTLDQLAEIGKKRLPPIAHYEQIVREMETTQNLLIEDVANLTEKIQKWARKNPAVADKLFDVMHKATLAGVDPSKSFESMTDLLQSEIDRLNRKSKSNSRRKEEDAKRLKELQDAIKNEPFRRQQHALLRDQFSKLPNEAKQYFDDIKHHYKAQRGRMVMALEARIQKAQMEGSIKKEMLRRIRFDHERAEKELYFPLARFGDYWIDTVDENGERVFMMFETQTEMNRKLEALKDAGFPAKPGSKLYESQKLDGASLSFISDLINQVEGIENLNQDYKNDIGDMIYQLYLNSMPDRSVRRAYIHRKGVAGYSNDALRAMADQGFKQSRQQARLEHLDDLEGTLKTMKELAEESSDIETRRIYSETVKRHEWVLNPARSPVAQKLTSLGFVWMLGLSPASALTNLTQTIIMALPMIGARYGMAKTSMAMAKASQEFTSAIAKRIKSGDSTYGIVGHVLEGLEKKAIRDAILAGCIDTTQAADLIGLAENPSAKYNGTYNKAMNIIGWAFHHAEVMNREVTFLTAYRLEYAKTKNHDTAVQTAIQLTNKAHFNYGSLNRARFMQSDVAAVALQFKQYSQNMIYYLMSNLYAGFRDKNISREEKRIAKKQLLWTLGITFGIGGLGALPLGALMTMASIVQMGAGDDDDPFDPEVELKRMLSDYFGPDIAAALWFGAVPPLSSRISLDSLIWRDVDRDEKPADFYQAALMQLSGPVIGGIGLSVANGIGDLVDGQTARGIEKMTPKAVKDVLKAVRYINEGGVVNKYGSPLVDDLTAGEIAQQVMGFTPGRVSMRYDQNSAQKEAEMHVKNRRTALMGAYYMSWREGDSSETQDIIKKIQAFNRSKWGRMMPIKGVDLQRSIRRRQMNLAESKNGMKLNKKLSGLTKDLEYFSN